MCDIDEQPQRDYPVKLHTESLDCSDTTDSTRKVIFILYPGITQSILVTTEQEITYTNVKRKQAKYFHKAIRKIGQLREPISISIREC